MVEQAAAQKLTVLVVEDDHELREITVKLMKKKGFDVLEAENGQNALKVLETNSINIVVSDIRMPGGDGVDLLKSIKKKNDDIPVLLFVSGFADLTPMEAYALGAAGILSKPYSRRELVEHILRLCQVREERWQTPPEAQPRLSFEKKISRELRFGKGGFALPISGEVPQQGDYFRFSLELEKNPPVPKLAGIGQVRWIERTPQGEVILGTEFQYLEDFCRSQVSEYLASLESPAFIPQVEAKG